MHYSSELYQAIAGRLKGDATLAALLDGDGVYSVEAPESVASYIVVQIQGVRTESEAFRAKARDMRIAITIVVPRNLTAASPLVRKGEMAERVEGDWYAQAFGSNPSFGLDRFTPTLSNWECTPLIFEESVDLGDDKVLAQGMSFTCIITKGAV